MAVIKIVGNGDLDVPSYIVGNGDLDIPSYIVGNGDLDVPKQTSDGRHQTSDGMCASGGILNGRFVNRPYEIRHQTADNRHQMLCVPMAHLLYCGVAAPMV